MTSGRRSTATGHYLGSPNLFGALHQAVDPLPLATTWDRRIYSAHYTRPSVHCHWPLPGIAEFIRLMTSRATPLGCLNHMAALADRMSYRPFGALAVSLRARDRAGIFSDFLLLQNPTIGVDHGWHPRVAHRSLAPNHRDPYCLPVDHHIDRHWERETFRSHPLELQDAVGRF